MCEKEIGIGIYTLKILFLKSIQMFEGEVKRQIGDVNHKQSRLISLE